MHYYAQYPLVNEESHCTASFHSSWLFFEFVPKMAKMKTTPRKADILKKKKEKEPSKWGDAAHVGFHRPPLLPARDNSGNPSYKGMNVKYMYYENAIH